ncbi:uncharacterized protein LOC122070656 [Macadamia integrifolia]|uniref:uncharacterized protein LOC122070656 n=1 Tax=Macadamia integrifolia TaxID=60698 RepID=UPI001C4ECD98|nr:uncharacterized protein LOC122070656 [Macadamia integrifolia]XP_042490786.1 uncharacterized protein LOC122070656 [Macadamia integrifolia]XP_042490787.1 uncharacterized protein LOC122070656 [Macadamia integrifolia]XP_042490788.1 uncharacterized protein LOC122070656 [Macadamia integrifolia]
MFTGLRRSSRTKSSLVIVVRFYRRMIKMDEHEEADSSAENPPIGNEEIEDEHAELTATPLKKYVTFVVDRKEGNSCKWTCNFGCRSEPYTGTYSRVRAHLIGLLPGQKSQGIIICPKVKKEEREKMKAEEDEAKRVFGSSSRRVPVSSSPIGLTTWKTSTSIVVERGRNALDASKTSSADDVDGVIARFFYGNGIPFDVAKSPFWGDMVKAINEAPRGYKPPCADKIATTLLLEEKTKVDQALMFIKQRWRTYGVSVVSDGWTNLKNQPLMNFIAVSDGKAVFINVIDCSGDEKSSEFIANLLLEAIESVGTQKVFQVLTDNSSICRDAGKIIETRYPHIFWSGSMAHGLSLLMKDIVKSAKPNLAFVGENYERAKRIMRYINNHSSAMYIFRTFPALDVIRVSKSRFGHHFVVLEGIARVKNALVNLVLSEEWEKLKRGGSKSNLEHEEVKRTILDDDFWKMVTTILAFIKPIWEMICFCDSDKATIGEVYPKLDAMLGCIKDALLDSIEAYQVVSDLFIAQWKQMNIPLYGLAYVLTPFYYSGSWLTGLAQVGEKRNKPHADPDVHKAYLDALDRLVSDSKKAAVVRQQLSDFVSNRGVFARPQAIKDRETMSALSWWDLYGVTAPELYGLAVRVLSQSVNTSCVESGWSTYGYIHDVKRNRLNPNIAKSLTYVHYNNRLLTRYREDFESMYKDWDAIVSDDDLDNDMKGVQDRENSLLYNEEEEVSIATSGFPSYAPSHGSSALSQAHRLHEIAQVKRPRSSRD